MLVEEAWEVYRRECGDDILFWNRQRLAHQHLAALDGIAVESLKPSVIREATKDLTKLSTSTIRRDLQALNAALNTCRKLGLIQHQPHIPLPKASEPRKQYATWEEMGAILKRSEREPQWLRTLAMLLCYTGQRLGVVMRLTWEDIDMKDRVIWFTSKRSGRQKMAANVWMTDELHEYLRQLKECVNPGAEELVVCDANKRKPCSVLYRWRGMVKAAGLSANITPHIMRHSVATNLVQQGVPLIKVSKLLGHSSTAITERVYAKFAPEFTKEVANAIRPRSSGD